MKLSVALDLAPARALALHRIDIAFARRVPARALDDLRAVKAAHARRVIDAGETAHPAISIEARSRGIEDRDLCAAIVAAAAAASTSLLDIEAERQAAKAAVRAAPDHHTILAIVAEAEGHVQ